MRVRCYVEGCADRAKDYADETPLDAALLFIEEWHYDEDGNVNVCVEPIDDDARALVGWRSDEDTPQYRMFVVSAAKTFSAREVATLNPYYKALDASGARGGAGSDR